MLFHQNYNSINLKIQLANMETKTKRLVACPKCKKLAEFSPSNSFRPFCSERCKMIDLGLWASEGYAIPVEIKEEDLESQFSDGNFSSQ